MTSKSAFTFFCLWPLLTTLFSTGVQAKDNVVKELCLASFNKESKIPTLFRETYCLCISKQATSRLSTEEYEILKEVNASEKNNKFSEQLLGKIKSSNISNTITQATSYCMEKYLSDDYKIVEGTNGFRLFIGCNMVEHALSVSLTIYNGKYTGYLSSPSTDSWEELDKYINNKIKVEYKIDEAPYKIDYWNESTDFSHYVLEAPNPEYLLKKINKSKKLILKIIDTKKSIYLTEFNVTGYFPDGWQACKPNFNKSHKK
ncbi:hypothetical protein [Candidatus Methylomicrobium oryzae]|uniref:hypothetical protein n=1 Tax=Candidatus Methylomicrobium oryzae TaxID=2802053 RepID=UPI00192127E9|nr:hypothetical protein [Methylomicrobium sp. RS1]MBL1263632.1 hypothetical protein [Methylomicrobium sp. RS1]